MQHSNARDRRSAASALAVLRYFTLAAFLGAILVPTTSCAKHKRAAGKGGASAQPRTARAAAGAPTKGSIARMLVRTVRMDLAVDKVDPARSQVERIARDAGGYVHTGAYTVEGKRRRWNATLKVPPATLNKVTGALRGVGKVQGETLNTVEVTAAVMDVRARLKSHRIAEQRLQQIALQKTASVKELLSVEKELARLRSQIEKLEATERHYAGSVGLATITVGLRPRLATAAKPSAWSRVSGAFAAGLQHMWDFLVFLAVVIGHLWPLMLLFLAISVVIYRLRRLLRLVFVTLFGVKPAPATPAYAAASEGYRAHYGYVDPRAYPNHTAYPSNPDQTPPSPDPKDDAD